MKDARAGAWFAEEWTARLGEVVESLSMERPRLACSPSPEGPSLAAGQEADEGHGMLWWQQSFPLPGDPVLWIGAPQGTWFELASRVLRAAGEEDPSQARETYLEILQQSFGELGRSASRRWDRQLTCPPPSEQPGPPPSGEYYLVEAAYPDATLPALLAVITGAPEEPAPGMPAPPPQALAAAAPATFSPRQAKTFDLLMGVELPVSVSFGHVQIALRDVLKLTAGSIVELNRTVDEPVEIIVNNCVVARGEVVVVEGNYGVRIHQIMSREARLEALP